MVILLKNIHTHICSWEIHLFSSPCPCLVAAWARAVRPASRWGRGSQSLTLETGKFILKIKKFRIISKDKIFFLSRRRKKWNLLLLTVGVGVGVGVGVRVLVAVLRKLMQLHMVHHHLNKQK